MASPLAPAKPTVDLAKAGPRVSRIRRDPPLKVKEITVAEQHERDARTVVIGILVFSLAFLFIAIGVANWLGWSPREYTAYL